MLEDRFDFAFDFLNLILRLNFEKTFNLLN